MDEEASKKEPGALQESVPIFFSKNLYLDGSVIIFLQIPSPQVLTPLMSESAVLFLLNLQRMTTMTSLL